MIPYVVGQYILKDSTNYPPNLEKTTITSFSCTYGFFIPLQVVGSEKNDAELLTAFSTASTAHPWCWEAVVAQMITDRNSSRLRSHFGLPVSPSLRPLLHTLLPGGSWCPVYTIWPIKQHWRELKQTWAYPCYLGDNNKLKWMNSYLSPSCMQTNR